MSDDEEVDFPGVDRPSTPQRPDDEEADDHEPGADPDVEPEADPEAEPEAEAEAEAEAEPDADAEPADEPKQQDSEDAMSDIFGSSSDAGTPRTPGSPETPEESVVPPRVRILEPEVCGAIDETRQEEEDEDGEVVARPIGPPLKISAPLTTRPDKSTLKLVKMTNFVAIEKRPFDPNTYRKVDPENEAFGDQAVVRWRVNENGERESNSRFVRWDDGRLSFFIGEECFDVDERDVDNSFLYLRHQNVMQSMGGISKKFIFRPAEVKKRRVKVGGQAKGAKRQMAKVQKITTLTDPAKEKEEKTRREEERIRDRELLARKQKKEMQKYYVPHATELDGEYMDSPEGQGAADNYRGRARQNRRESLTNKRPPSKRDPVAHKPKKQKHDDFIDEGEEAEEDDDYVNEEEFMEEPEWNEDEDTDHGDQSGEEQGHHRPDQRKRAVEKEADAGPDLHGAEEDDGEEESDDGGIGVVNRSKPKRGRTLVLSDEDDEI